MAKYINVDTIENEEMKHYQNTLNLHDAKLFVEFMSWIDDIPPADVVSKEDYDHEYNLRKELDLELYNTKNENVEFHSKVNNAIEELRKEIEDNDLNIIKESKIEYINKRFVYGAIDRCIKKIKEI